MMDVDAALRIAREGYSAGYTEVPGHQLYPLPFGRREEAARNIVWRNLVEQAKGDARQYDHPLRHVIIEMEDCE